MNLESFTRLIAAMLAYHKPEKWDATMTEIYYQALADVPEGRLSYACSRAIRELKWFPKVCELRELAGANRSQESVSEDAWTTLNEAIKKVSYRDSIRLPGPLAEAVRRMGGWKRVWWRRNINTDDNDWIPWGRKHFMEVFASTENQTWDEYVAGEIELQNQTNELNALAENMPERAVKYKFEVQDLTGQKALPAGTGA
jgi:hypothetical protein